MRVSLPECGITVIDDYAHHPAAVSAVLATIHGMLPNRRLGCVFQPHQVSRTERLLDKLAQSLQNADKVLVAEMSRAREGKPRPGEVTAADLAERTTVGGAEVLPGHSSEDLKIFAKY
jgi:UDP-N-acetylmuramate--alanine ligase